jgi:hypothetical protein
MMVDGIGGGATARTAFWARRRTSRLPLLFLGACLGVLLLAGEGMAGAAGGFGPPEGAAVDGPDDPEVMNLEQLMEMQSYTYVRTGGRDPFTIRLPEVKEEPAEAPEDDQEPTVAVDVPGRPAEAVQEKTLNRAYRKARTSLIAGDYEGALKTCEETVRMVTEEWDGTTSSEAARLYERLMSLRGTAQRLANREAIRNEFESLAIVVEGVRWSPRGSAALINDKVVEPGMVLTVGQDALLQVESVEKDGVVFLFKGQRLRKSVSAEDGGEE